MTKYVFNMTNVVSELKYTLLVPAASIAVRSFCLSAAMRMFFETVSSQSAENARVSFSAS